MKKKIYQESKVDVDDKVIINPYTPLEEAIRYKNKDKIIEILKKDPTLAIKIPLMIYYLIAHYQDFDIFEVILDNIIDNDKVILLNMNNSIIITELLYYSSYNVDKLYNFIKKYQSFIQWNIPQLKYISDDEPYIFTLLEKYIFENCLNKECSFKLLDLIYDNYKPPYESFSLIASILFKCYLSKIPVNYSLIEYLIKEKKENINGYYGRFSNLLLAALLNDIELLKLFKKYNIKIDNRKSNIIISYLSILEYNNRLAEKNEDIIIYLIENNVDVNITDKYLYTLAHYIFLNASYFSDKLKRYVLEKTHDLSSQNVNGNTVLHFIVANDDWKKYTDILEKKPLDIYCKNKGNFSVLNIIKSKNNNDELNLFLTLVAKSFKYLSKSSDELDKIINYIFKRKNSLPKDIELNDVRITDYKYANYNIFSSTYQDILLHYFVILSNYEDLGIPYYPESNLDTFKNMSVIFKDPIFNNYFNESFFNGKFVLSNFKELQNIKIFWCDEENYVIPPDLDKAINYTFNLGKKYIIMFLSINNKTLSHANTLIFDSIKKKIYHFEPHGLQTSYIGKLYETLNTYFKKILPDYEYICPTKFLPSSGYQSLTYETDYFKRKIGDLEGYCAAWCEWFIELYLQNKNYPIDKLVTKSIKKLINTKYSLLEHIRNYANHIQKNSNQILNEFNIPDTYMNMYMSDVKVSLTVFKNIADRLNDMYEP